MILSKGWIQKALMLTLRNTFREPQGAIETQSMQVQT